MNKNNLLKPVITYTLFVVAAITVFVLGTKLRKTAHTEPSKTGESLVNMGYLKNRLASIHEYVKNGDDPKAIDQLNALLQYERTFATVHFNLGRIYLKNRKHREASHHLKKAVELAPRDANAHTFLGVVLRDAGKCEEAKSHFETAITLEPQYFDAHLQLGKTYYEMGQHDQALESFHHATKISPKNILAHLNMAYTYNKTGDIDKAIELYKQVIRIDPNCQNAHYNLGYSLKHLGKLEEALAPLNKAIELKADYLEAHIARAEANIALKKFDEGWEEFEWRWGLFGIDPIAYRNEMWDGSDIQGKTVLLRTEQGLGDTMQFVRLAKEIKKRGAKKVVCKVQKPLVKLLSNCDFIDKVVYDVKDAGTYDCFAHLMSLPRIFKMQPSQIPAEIPYLKADPILEKEWAKKLAKDKNFKVGLCWNVDPFHETKKSPWSTRSVSLKQLKPLATLKGVTFYSLQKFENLQLLADLPKGMKLQHFGTDFDKKNGSFMDSAAIIKNLDLVITVDTCIAHLAGALGKPVWMLLPYAPDCRWYLHTDKTEWYPTMTLFRQTKPQSWDAPINNIAIALGNEVKKHKTS